MGARQPARPLSTAGEDAYDSPTDTTKSCGQRHTSIANTAEARLAELEAKVNELAGDDAPFAERLHLNALGLRFMLDREHSIAGWARWALDQTTAWRSTANAGTWDHRQALEEHTPRRSNGRPPLRRT